MPAAGPAASAENRLSGKPHPGQQQLRDNAMRIIAGRHRGTKLAQLVGADTRPTADRVRESLFNILEGGRFGQVLADAIVIDAFAGTGALGLEALSRGARSARFVERDMKALSVLRANIDRLRCSGDCQVVAGDATGIAAWQGPPATLMFADAPYGSGSGFTAAQGIARVGGLAHGALVIVETDKSEQPPEEDVAASGMTVLESRRYGRANLHFLEFSA